MVGSQFGLPTIEAMGTRVLGATAPTEQEGFYFPTLPEKMQPMPKHLWRAINLRSVAIERGGPLVEQLALGQNLAGPVRGVSLSAVAAGRKDRIARANGMSEIATALQSRCPVIITVAVGENFGQLVGGVAPLPAVTVGLLHMMLVGMVPNRRWLFTAHVHWGEPFGFNAGHCYITEDYLLHPIESLVVLPEAIRIGAAVVAANTPAPALLPVKTPAAAPPTATTPAPTSIPSTVPLTAAIAATAPITPAAGSGRPAVPTNVQNILAKQRKRAAQTTAPAPNAVSESKPGEAKTGEMPPVTDTVVITAEGPKSISEVEEQPAASAAPAETRNTADSNKEEAQ